MGCDVGGDRHTGAVNSEYGRVEVVGTGVTGSLTRAATYLQQLSQSASNVDDLLTHLGEAIASARLALEKCLHGYDSFDTLAFLRFAVGPWDFSEV